MSSAPTNIISSASRQAAAARRAERDREIDRLGTRIAQARGAVKYQLCSELLAFLGFIHNTPFAREKWEGQ